ncbi:MAG: hypothetical protein AB8G95_11225 [Anaerolineae bacterium]
MQKIQSKFKSLIITGLFLALFLGLSFSTPESAAASVETVNTQISYQAEITNSEMVAYEQVVISPSITTDVLQDDKEDFIDSDQTGDDDDTNGYLEWFEKLLKKGYSFFKSLAWSG